jgi:hypothetical protein
LDANIFRKAHNQAWEGDNKHLWWGLCIPIDKLKDGAKIGPMKRHLFFTNQRGDPSLVWGDSLFVVTNQDFLDANFLT